MTPDELCAAIERTSRAVDEAAEGCTAPASRRERTRADNVAPRLRPGAPSAATGLRTNEWAALERRDVDRSGRAVTVQRRIADGVLTPYPKTERSRRRVPLTARAFDALESLPPRLDTPLLFPAPKGGPIGLATWRTRGWYPALGAAGIEQRRPYALRHTFATEALAAGVSIFGVASQGARRCGRSSRPRFP